MLAGSMPNSPTPPPRWWTRPRSGVATASSPAPRPSSSHCRAAPALVSVSRVVKVLERHDEERLGRVEVVGLGVEVDRVDVRDEAALDGRVGVVAQRLVGHGRTEVGSADADVDHGADPPAGVRRSTAPERIRSATAPSGRARGARRPPRPARRPRVRLPGHPQGHVEHRPVLGGVDVLAGEHGVAPLLDPGPAGHGHQGAEHLGVDPVLRVVEVEVAGGRATMAVPRPGSSANSSTEVAVPHPLEVPDQAPPLPRPGDPPLRSCWSIRASPPSVRRPPMGAGRSDCGTTRWGIGEHRPLIPSVPERLRPITCPRTVRVTGSAFAPPYARSRPRIAGDASPLAGADAVRRPGLRCLSRHPRHRRPRP